MAANKQLVFDIIGRDRGAAAAVNKVSNQLLAVGTTAGVALGVAVAKFADFDAQMSIVQDGTRATAAELEQLRTAALDAGAKTKFSATESAAAIDALGRAGVSTSDILSGGLSGALDLAASGQLDVARAAEIAATAMTQFKLKGSDVPHIADLLAAGAGKAQGTVDDLAQALDQAGLVASQTGLSIEETTGGLAAFASAGLLGSDAGTSFKTMLQRLTPQSAEARNKMTELGISAYDAQGNFIGLEAFAGNLRQSLQKLTPEARNAALAVIFGSDSVRAASVLYEQGAAGISKWIKQTNDAGYAAESARIQTDNLKGDLEELGGSFETALIQQGSGANDVLRTLTQTATGLVSGFASLPEPVQATITVVGALTAGTLLLTGAALKVVPAINNVRTSLGRLRANGVSVGKVLGKGAGVAGALLTLTTIAAGANAETELTTAQLSKLQAAFKTGGAKQLTAELDIVNEQTGALRDILKQLYSGNFGENTRLFQGIGSFVDTLTFNVFRLDEAFLENDARLREWGSSLAELANTDIAEAQRRFAELAEAAGGDEEAVRLLLRAMPDYEAQLRTLAGAQGATLTEQELFNVALGKGDLAAQLARDSAARNAGALAELQGKAEDATASIDELAEAVRGFGSAELDTREAHREFEEATDRITENLQQQRDAYEQANGSLEGWAASLDTNTAEGRENEAALDALAKSTLELAATTIEQTGNQTDANNVIADGRQRLIDMLGQFGITGQSAQDYADKLGLIPSNVNTALTLTGDQDVYARLMNVQSMLRQVTGQKNLHIATGAGGQGGLVPGAASGGAINGPGPKGVDSVLMMAAPGEHMLTAADVDAMGGQQAVYEFRRALHASATKVRDAGRASTASRGTLSTAAFGRADVSTAKPVHRHLHIHNPVFRDPVKDEREAADLVRAAMDV